MRRTQATDSAYRGGGPPPLARKAQKRLTPFWRLPAQAGVNRWLRRSHHCPFSVSGAVAGDLVDVPVTAGLLPDVFVGRAAPTRVGALVAGGLPDGSSAAAGGLPHPANPTRGTGRASLCGPPAQGG